MKADSQGGEGTANRLLLVNPSWEQDDLIDRARSAGYKLHGISIYGEEHRPDSGFDRWASLKGRDFGEALRLAQAWEVDHVVSTQCDYALQLQSYIADVMDLPGPGFLQSQRSGNKWLQRQALDRLSTVSQPPSRLCHDLTSAGEAAEELDWEVIVKPIDSRGSIGVSVVNHPRELRESVHLAIANSLSGLFLVEQRVHGTLYLVEGIGGEAVVVGRKRMNERFSYMNDDIMFASATHSGEFRKVARAHEAVCEELQYDRGLTSGEYMCDEGRVHVIETTNRGGGVWIGSKVVGALTGLDTSAILLQDFAGGATPLAYERAAAVYLRYICLDPGYLESLAGWEGWEKHPNYLGHKIWQEIPGRVAPVTDAWKRSGVLLTRGREPEEAEKAAMEMIRELDPRYRSPQDEIQSGPSSDRKRGEKR